MPRKKKEEVVKAEELKELDAAIEAGEVLEVEPESVVAELDRLADEVVVPEVVEPEVVQPEVREHDVD